MLWPKKMHTLRSIMILNFSVLFIVSFSVIGYTYYHFFAKSIKDNTRKGMNAVVDQVTMNIDTYLGEVESSLRVLSANRSILSSISEPNKDAYESLKTKEDIGNLFSYIAANKNDVQQVFVYNKNEYFSRNEFIDIGSPFLSSLWNRFKDGNNQTVFLGSHRVDYRYGMGKLPDALTVAVPIRDINHGGTETLALAVFDFNISKIKSIFESVKNRHKVEGFILDENSKPIYRTGSEDLFPQGGEEASLLFDESGSLNVRSGHRNDLIVYKTSGVSGWKIGFYIPMSDMESELEKIKIATIASLLFMLLFTFLLSTYISTRSTVPIRKLLTYMTHIGNGRFDIRIPKQENYLEISMLNKGFNAMLDKIDGLIKEVYEWRYLQKEASFAALQAQINPHFMYNTLQSINSLAVLNRSEDIQKVTTALRSILEYAVYDQHDLVPVFNELNNAESYLELQKIRYGNRLKTIFDIDENILSHSTVKLIVQPILENAINHGLNGKEGDWVIEIRGALEEGGIELSVRDNGVGVSEERLRSVRERLANQDVKEITGIGLSNIANRLHLKFGSEGKLDIQSQEGAGTTVVLRFPKRS